ncbi:hypothetical protein F5Y10DRAFT_284886 [Nemania abortiva]|nr:hypothetical protein F5Y10DRAFT_284886 [Nemania abortiva]
MDNIESSFDASPTEAAIFQLACECDALFKRMRQPGLGEAIEEFFQLQELHDSFIYWAGHLGIFALEDAGLDSWLRNHAAHQDLVWSTLDMLKFHINRFPTSKVPTANNAQSNESSSILEDIEIFIDELGSLVIFIQQPSTSPLDLEIQTFRRSEVESDIIQFRKMATLALRNLYRNAPEDLLWLLSKSMVDRYVKLLYWQSHDKKLRNDSQPAKILVDEAGLTRAKSSPEIRPKHERCSDDEPQVPSAIPQPQRKASNTEPPILSSRTPTELLEARERPSIKDDTASSALINKIDYSTTKPRHDEDHSKCLFCMKILTEDILESTSNWRRHVDEDLSPFVCLSNDCQPTLTFSKYGDWDRHMVYHHGKDWTQTIYMDGVEIEIESNPGAWDTDNTPYEMQGTSLFRNEKFCPLCCLSLEQTHLSWNSGEAEIPITQFDAEQEVSDGFQEDERKRMIYKRRGSGKSAARVDEMYDFARNTDEFRDPHPSQAMSRHIATHLRFIAQLSIHLGRSSGKLLEESQSQHSTSIGSFEAVPTESQQTMSETSSIVVSEPGHSRVFSVPLPKNEQFTGRETVLRELADKLLTERRSQIGAIVGLSGVGKTQVALQLVYWAKETKPEYSIFWIPASSFASFEQAYREMVIRLNIPIKEEEDIKETLKRYLESREFERWLLVVDNADDKEIVFGPYDNRGGIYEYLPRSDDISILFTTRSRQIARTIAESNLVNLGEMGSEETASFLERALVDKYKQPPLLYKTSTAEELLKELTCFPLAIAQAVAYLNQNLIPIEEYLALLRDANQDLVGLIIQKSDYYTRNLGLYSAVATTWLVSFDQIRKSNNNAAELLSFLSCIEPKAIPQSILPGPPAQEEKELAISTLCEYAFLTRRRADDMLDMDPFVHLAIQVWMQAYGAIEMTKATNTIHHLASIFARAIDWELRRQYVPHALHALETLKHLHVGEKAELMREVGYCLCADDLSVVYVEKGHVTDAIEIFEHVVAFLQKTLAGEDPFLLTSENNLAHAYLTNGRVTDAIKILERVVAIRQETLEEDDRSRLASENNLAQAYLQDGRVTYAISILEHITAVCQRTLADTNRTLLSLKHALAKAYLEGKRVTDAIKILQPVVAIHKRLSIDDYSALKSSHMLLKAYGMR